MTLRRQLLEVAVRGSEYNKFMGSHVSGGECEVGTGIWDKNITIGNMYALSPASTPQIPGLGDGKYKKPRTSKPKVRSGCFTCKKRRVKCDETKPQCHRCCKFGRVCSGYKKDKPEYAERESRVDARAILPKNQSTASCIPEPRYDISKVMFEATQEFLAFRLFCTETSRELTGVFESSIWNRIVLQASHQYTFLRHAIITIGSLSKCVKDVLNENLTSSDGANLFNSPPACLRSNNDFALRQYNKFLHGSRQALFRGPEAQRLALIVCLLIICIETLQWHHLQVLSHIYSGVQLLDSFLASKNQEQDPTTSQLSSSHPIEGEIVEQFRMLEVEASMLFDPFPASHHHILSLEGTDLISQMPSSFTSISEAKHYLDLITRRTRHFIASIKPSKPNPPCLDRETIDPEFLKPGLRSTFDSPSPSLLPDDDSINFSLALHLQEISFWQTSFSSLSTTPTPPTYLPTLLLQILSHALSINLSTSLSPSPLAYDAHISTFETIVSLSTLFLHHPDSQTFLPRGAYSASTGLIGPLRLCAENCRSRPLRRAAISLLRSRPWREGVWWSCSSAQLGAWLTSVEEDGVPENEEIPEGKRARLCEVGIWEEGAVTTVRVVAVRGMGRSAEVRVGEWIWRVGGEEGRKVVEYEGMCAFEREPERFMTLDR